MRANALIQRRILSSANPHDLYDCTIIGAGVVGCAIARRFALTGLKVAVIERANDVGEGGASKSNSAIIHTGFDSEYNSLETKLVRKASREWPQLCKQLKIPFQEIGAIMIGRTQADLMAIEKYYQNSLKNEVKDVELLTPSQCRELEPNCYPTDTLLGGLHIPRESIIDPFTVSSRFSEIAFNSGNCDFFFQTNVDIIKQNEGKYITIGDSNQKNFLIKSKTLINSAGIRAKQVASLYFDDEKLSKFNLNPRRGQFLVYDTNSSHLLKKILLPIPTSKAGKGILITPTIFGNLLCGPTAEDLSMDDLHVSTQTTKDGLELVKENVKKMLPKLIENYKPISQYAGARSNCKEGSYLFEYGTKENPNIVTLFGIRSTGLSASFTIADEVFENMLKRNLISPKIPFSSSSVGIDTLYPSWYERKMIMNDNSSPQEIRNTVCFCEGVDEKDIETCLNNSKLAPETTDSIKRRTRITTGRCQGFNCLFKLCQIISREKRIKINKITKNGPGTEWFPNYNNQTTSPSIIRSSVTNNNEFNEKTKLYMSSPTAFRKDEYFQAIVIGAGPAGCGMALGLANSNKFQKILLLERSDRMGGIPARYPKSDKKTFFSLKFPPVLVSGYEFTNQLQDLLYNSPNQNKISLKLKSMVIQTRKETGQYHVKTHDGNSFISDVLIFATGAREANIVERGNITGHRTSRILYTNHLLSSGVSEDSIRLAHGSGLIGRSVLSQNNTTTDFIQTPKDEHPFVAQQYFKGNNPIHANVPEISLYGPRGYVEEYKMPNTTAKNIDEFILSGCLVPNDEVLVNSTPIYDDSVTKVGNLKATSNTSAWPAFFCYHHAKHYAASKIAQNILQS